MGILKKKEYTPWEKAFRAVWKKEERFLRRYETLKELYLFHHRYAGAMSVLYDLLSFDKGKILQGQVWRLFTSPLPTVTVSSPSASRT